MRGPLKFKILDSPSVPYIIVKEKPDISPVFLLDIKICYETKIFLLCFWALLPSE